METLQASQPDTHAPSPRRRYSLAFKRQAVQESLGSEPTSRVARKHNISVSQLFKWRKLYREGLLPATDERPELLPVSISDTSADTPISKPENTGTHSPGAIVITLAGGHRIVSTGSPCQTSLRTALEVLCR